MSSREGPVCSETDYAVTQGCTEGPPSPPGVGPAGQGSFRTWAPVWLTCGQWLPAPLPGGCLARALPSADPAWWPALVLGNRKLVGAGAGVTWPPHRSEAVSEGDTDGSKWGGVLVVVNNLLVVCVVTESVFFSVISDVH